MPGKHKHKRTTHIATAVAKAVVVIHREDQSDKGMLMPGRWGKRWEYEFADGDGEHLPRAAYDEASMAEVRKMGGLKKLIDRMFPSLNPERRMAMLADVGHTLYYVKDRKTGGLTKRIPGGIAAIIQAKKVAYDKALIPALVTSDDRHRARRLTRKEKRKVVDHRKRLKQLLAK